MTHQRCALGSDREAGGSSRTHPRDRSRTRPCIVALSSVQLCKRIQFFQVKRRASLVKMPFGGLRNEVGPPHQSAQPCFCRAGSAIVPKDAPWDRTHRECHAAFQCMWMQFDHVLPHSRGGDSLLTKTVVTCAPCNFGRWHRMLEEVGLIDPRVRPVKKTSWDGLERFMPEAQATCDCLTKFLI